ncbi:CinA family protein [Thermodesulfovibrio yellowstonii]|uniref:CinA family protein n=1 Tax=Thermodesulfovibrio yellowstonii TaxID=28262 RepID=UPI0024B3B7E8|nr:CinA family protein [Thermodesulfovibrio yellowstonii]MDI6864492.1 CinA family protein [Thermodesulfovibrio yellowstonii]
MHFLNSIAFNIIKKLIQTGKTLSTAESCTGGLIASSITDIPGASKVFIGGMVVYATEMKLRLLGVAKEVLDYGVISSQMAEEMALKIRLLTGSDYSIATTGNLGPDVMEGKPKGLIYIAIATPEKVYIKELKLQGDRQSNKTEATEEALKLFLELL